MTWLILGLLLWTGAHLFKRVLPGPRAALGNAGRGLVAVLILIGVGLMIVGYRQAETDAIYALPVWAWHLNNGLMLVAIYLMGAGRARGVVAAKLRHPMLTGVVVFAAAHLLVNGDWPSIVLFGGLGLWALIEMAVINRAEGPWDPPQPGPVAKDVKVAAIAVVVYAAIVGIHYWLDRSVIALLW